MHGHEKSSWQNDQSIFERISEVLTFELYTLPDLSSTRKPRQVLIFNFKLKKRPKEKMLLYSGQMTIKLFTNHTHVTLMLPSTQLLPSQYLHLDTPTLTLGPASGDEGEFVTLPLCIFATVPVVELWMLQEVFPSSTLRNLVSPSTFLKTGRPELHLPSSNLLLESAINSLYLNIFGWWW